MSALHEEPEPLGGSGNTAAQWDTEWLKFYRNWRPKLIAYLASITHHDTRFIEEVAQESFLKHRMYWAGLEDIDRAHAYLFKIARRKMMRCQERESRCQPFPETAPYSNDLQTYRVAPDDAFDLGDTRREVLAAIRRLSPRRAEAVTLFYLLDFPVRDIADIQQITRSTVRAHLTLGRQELAKLLHENDENEGIDGGVS
ncbi:MAG: RNA polymerase sigma factor [Labedaea sp.]